MPSIYLCRLSLSSSQRPQLHWRLEASWLIYSSDFVVLLSTWWSRAAGLPPTGQHLQSFPHPVLSARGLPPIHADSFTTGTECSYEAQARATLLCEHRQSSPKQVRSSYFYIETINMCKRNLKNMPSFKDDHKLVLARKDLNN